MRWCGRVLCGTFGSRLTSAVLEMKGWLVVAIYPFISANSVWHALVEAEIGHLAASTALVGKCIDGSEINAGHYDAGQRRPIARRRCSVRAPFVAMASFA
jgi:hypothetical protein